MPCPAILQGEGLLHDARNLMGALGLYCDLLSMPGVLKQEHRHYADEVRLLGARSLSMIQRLMEPFQPLQLHDGLACSSPNNPLMSANPRPGSRRAPPAPESNPEPVHTGSPVSLRSVVERCSGLLSRVAGGRAIEISYGAAASVPVRLSEEAAERILVNLVRNAAAALNQRCPARDRVREPGEPAAELPPAPKGNVPDGVSETAEDPVADATPGAIRISVGLLANRIGEPKPWPFQRVRLTIEDSGCGMSPEQVEQLVSAGRVPSQGSHGIGFHVVQDLVAASSGDLKVMSSPGIGTWVQIEWPMAIVPSTGATEHIDHRPAGIEKRLSC